MLFDLPPLRVALYFSLVSHRLLSKMLCLAYTHGYSGPLFVGPFWLVRCEAALHNPSAKRRSFERGQQLLWSVPRSSYADDLRSLTIDVPTDPVVVELLFTTILTVPWSIFM